MNKFLILFNALCVAFFVVAILFISNKVARLRTSQNSSNDTTIIINKYYDTTFYEIHNITYKQSESHYYKDYDTLLSVGNCDSVRKYTLNAENDTIKIEGTCNVHGILLNHDLSYKWKLPYKTEIETEIVKYRRGLLIGFGVQTSDTFAISLNTGFADRKGNIYSIGYNTQNQILLNYYRIIKFKR